MVTPEQIKAAFKTLSKDRANITIQDLQVGGVPPNVIEYFASTMPDHESGEGFDYSNFVGLVFN